MLLFQSLSGESGVKVGCRFADRIEHERRVDVTQSAPDELVERVESRPQLKNVANEAGGCSPT
jgi:hypothetical protein